MPKLTLVVNTKNEEENIERCLKSVEGLADDILVVDMNSSDRTVKLAKNLGAKVLNYKKEHGFADPARNFALSKTDSDWILILDADEELSQQTKDNLKKAVKQDNFDVFYLPRKNIIFSKWMEYTGWWPDYQPRLFRKGHLEWPGVVHAQPIVRGRINYLPDKEEYAITHHNYKNIEQYLEKLNRYTSLSARKDFAKKMATPTSPAQTFEQFFGEFLSRYFAHQGIKDGVHGAGLSLLQASYELVYFLKKWEIADYPVIKYDQESGIRQLRKVQQDLDYWIADYYVRNSYGLKKIYWMIRRRLKR